MRISTSLMTLEKRFVDIFTVFDYIFVYVFTIVWIAYCCSFGLGGDAYLDGKSGKVSELRLSLFKA